MNTTYESTRPGFAARVKPGALKAIMDYNKMTYREAAMRCKVSVGTIGHIAKGTRRNVSPATAGKIAKGFNVDPDSLFEFVSTV